jgi:hypothetical protein
MSPVGSVGTIGGLFSIGSRPASIADDIHGPARGVEMRFLSTFSNAIIYNTPDGFNRKGQ